MRGLSRFTRLATLLPAAVQRGGGQTGQPVAHDDHVGIHVGGP